MGASFSEAAGVVANVKTYSHPSKADWITAHAKATGCYIDEERFVRAVGSVPVETLTAVLHVSILPEPDVPQMSQDMESASPPMTSPSPSQSLPEPRELPTDEELADIASKIHRLDWQRLANKLGFLESDIRQFEQHQGNTEQKVLQMLEKWRAGDAASTELLKTALQDCGMNDAATILATS
ncbi:hypothetical protein NP493_170g00034 [Ridgeia piscesae]|uniref:Death domain-containing protein n=1 Tax=Ridgeia piscesae TaxID=27915 RepID=A0AAD9P365_RIDPI|nr:hypothetical protein NP493_170g00034 [Ridgeia piscesae]